MEQKWELILFVKDEDKVANKCHDLRNLINNRFEGELDDNFVTYIQKLVQEQIGLHKLEKGLVNRINEILMKPQGNNSQQLKEKFTRIEIYTILLMMYFDLIDNNFDKRVFYLPHMRQMKTSNYQKAQEKHKCFLYYFKIFYEKFRNREVEQVIYIRDNSQQQEIDSVPKNIDFDILKQFTSSEERSIDIEGNNVIVDNADKNVGGQVLDGLNCAQEEITLLCYPEGVISPLFLKPMQNNEAIIILNAIRYNYYSGYENSFKHEIEQTQVVIIHHILMIDATQYFKPINQYQEQDKNREILKCYTGFKLALSCFKDRNITISTGKWGCGIFRGDFELKILIQIYGFWLAKEVLQLKNLSNIRFSYPDDPKFQNIINKYKESLKSVKQAIQLNEIIYKIAP